MAAAEGGRGGSKTLSKSVVTKKEFESFNSTASGIRGVIDTLQIQLAKLEDEIRCDEEGKMEYERTLSNLRIKREGIAKRMDFCETYLSRFDADLGPFQKTYENNTKSIGELYRTARVSHKKGIESLIREFDYHPAFKRPQDTFSAIPFDPKRL